MKIIAILFAFASLTFLAIDKEQLALDVSKADADNTELLKAFIWKRYSTVMVNGAEKATMITEWSFDEEGKLQAIEIDTETSVKKKRGIRGRVQENQMEENLDYVGEALKLALAYTYMTKGQLLDFYERSEVVEGDGIITATAVDVHAKGDKLVIVVDAETKLYKSKTFTSHLNQDVISGEIKYATFKSGVNHGAETKLNLPAKNAVITAVNKNYTKRVD